jgi:hypothetical protein
MSVSRRNFLGLGRYLLAAAAIPTELLAGKLLSAAGLPGGAGLPFSSAQTFLPLVNSSFAVHSASTISAWLTLLSVEDMTPKASAQIAPAAVSNRLLRAPQPKLNTFALHFLGNGEALPQGTYTVEHPALGKFSMFIVPSGLGAGQQTYTAVFNLLNTPLVIGRPFPTPHALQQLAGPVVTTSGPAATPEGSGTPILMPGETPIVRRPVGKD